MKKIISYLLVLTIVMSITACGTATTEEEADDKAVIATKYVTPTIVDDTITIPKSEISEKPLYVNYDASGTTVQLIFVIASDGTYRVSLNTCQSCNPSPRAYFTEKNGKLVCQNCGNQFTTDDVGVSARGCNPMNIEYEENAEGITLQTSVLDFYKEYFAKWQGPTS